MFYWRFIGVFSVSINKCNFYHNFLKMFNIDKIKKAIREITPKFIVREYHEYEKRPIEVEFYIEDICKSPILYWFKSLDELRDQIKSNGYSGTLISRKQSKTLEHLDYSFYNVVKEIVYVKQLTKCNSFYSIKFIDVNGDLYTLKKIKHKDLMNFPSNYYYLLENGNKVLCSSIYIFKICCYNHIFMKKYDELNYIEYPGCDIMYENYKDEIYNKIELAILELTNGTQKIQINDVYSIEKSDCKDDKILQIENLSVNTMGKNQDDFFSGNVKRWYLCLCYDKIKGKKRSRIDNEDEMIRIVSNNVPFLIKNIVI